MNPTITITIMAGFDGGRVVYESVLDETGTHDSRLVFGGDADQCSKYVADRIAKLEGQPAAPRQIEGPVKIRIRRKPEPVSDPLDTLDAMELVEGEAD